MMPEKLEVGKKYKLKNGNGILTILSIDQDDVKYQYLNEIPVYLYKESKLKLHIVAISKLELALL